MIQGLIRWLLPSENTFFAYLDQISANLIEGARILDKYRDAKGVAAMADIAKQIKLVEHEGDELARVMHDALDKTFVTPLDREDLHALTSALENTLDNLDGTAERIALYGFEELTEPMKQLVAHITTAITELSKAVACLKDMTRVDLIQLHLAHVNRLESEADAIYRSALGALFAGKEPIDAVTLVRNKDMLEVLENTVDVCAHAMTVIRTLVIKNL
ncbi:MAG: DUF47 family protein [Planctomycetes bacterium]|nr:DUF47 family protein [Planctomycetota bacterium]